MTSNTRGRHERVRARVRVRGRARVLPHVHGCAKVRDGRGTRRVLAARTEK